MKFEDVKDDIKIVNSEKFLEKNSDSLTFCTIEGLPSKGKLYPNGTDIKGRPLKLIELKKISTMTEENSDSVIADILKKSIRGINIDDINLADKLYIIFWLRANTYREPGYSVNFNCKKCEKESTYDFNLNSLQVKYISDEFSEDKLNFVMSNGDKIEFHLPKISDEKKINKFKNAYSSILTDTNSDFIDLAIMIDKINDEELDTIGKYEYILDLSPQLYSQLKSKIRKWDFGIKTELNVICNKCGGSSLVGITFREDFFIPDYTND